MIQINNLNLPQKYKYIFVYEIRYSLLLYNTCVVRIHSFAKEPGERTVKSDESVNLIEIEINKYNKHHISDLILKS